MTTGRGSMLLVVIAVSFGAVAGAQSTQPAKPLPRDEARERNLEAYTELLRSDLRTQKVAVVTELMQLTDAEDAVFWPIYRDHELELSRLNDERLALIEKYAEEYATLKDSTANDVVVKALDLEARRTALKQKYYSRLRTALSPRAAAKALQIEHQIQLLVDLQVAASLPVIQ